MSLKCIPSEEDKYPQLIAVNSSYSDTFTSCVVNVLQCLTQCAFEIHFADKALKTCFGGTVSVLLHCGILVQDQSEL